MTWPCNTCGAEGVRNLGTEGFCATHLTRLYATFDPSVWALAGVGLVTGPPRPDVGPALHDLTCNACGATWAGIPGDPCGWCQTSAERQLEHQQQLTLTPPDVDPDDALWATRIMAWNERLDVAVTAGVITERQARTAWRKATNHHEGPA